MHLWTAPLRWALVLASPFRASSGAQGLLRTYNSTEEKTEKSLSSIAAAPGAAAGANEAGDPREGGKPPLYARVAKRIFEELILFPFAPKARALVELQEER